MLFSSVLCVCVRSGGGLLHFNPLSHFVELYKLPSMLNAVCVLCLLFLEIAHLHDAAAFSDSNSVSCQTTSAAVKTTRYACK